jgi:hypothetical protein
MSRASIDAEVPEQFGQAIVRSDFAAAHALLSPDARKAHSPGALKQAVLDMISYSDESIQRAYVLHDFILDDWPEKQPGDVAWVYVALEADDLAEAAYVRLVTTDEGIRIREIQWGRP